MQMAEKQKAAFIKARKQYRCYVCGGIIEKGQHYQKEENGLKCHYAPAWSEQEAKEVIADWLEPMVYRPIKLKKRRQES